MSRQQYLRLLWADFDRVRAEYAALRQEHQRLRREIESARRIFAGVRRALDIPAQPGRLNGQDANLLGRRSY